MAITTTVTNKAVVGRRREIDGTLTFDDSYPTGGEPFTASDIGLTTIDRLDIAPQDGYVFEWDATNEKVIVRESGTASAALDEQDDTADLSGTTTTFVAVGK